MTDINGVIILDKPSNYDSHQVTALIKRMLNAEKIGHSGTLDPKVTGVLVIFLGKAIKLAAYLFKKDKEYVGVMRLHKEISITKLKETIKKKFTGAIRQTPPKKSAVKRQEREREIYSFKILEKKDEDVLFCVKCESGTYIRKLIHDLGEELSIGAHMAELRRTKEGNFFEDDCVSMYDIKKAIDDNKVNEIIQPMNIITKDMPKIIVKDEFLEKLYNGSPVFTQFVKGTWKGLKKGDIIAVKSEEGSLIEIAEVILDKDIVAKPKTVLKN